jgi:tetratricopeptide (TPR) repeat protein
LGDDTQLTSREPLGRLERWGFVLLLLASFWSRALCVIQYESSHPGATYPVIDEASYDSWGARIAEGDWLGSEVFFQEPLYPYFLGGVYSIAGHDLGAVRWVQCALGALTVALVFLLARRLFGRTAGWVAGVGLAGYGPALLLPCLLLKPNLFLPLATGFAYLLVLPGRSSRRWLALGLLGSLGALLRGNMLILLPLFAVGALVRGRADGATWRAAGSDAGAFVLGLVLVLLPVLVRNQVVGGVFALTTSGAGTNVYGGNNPENPLGVATEFSWVRGIPAYEAEDWRQEAERRTGRVLDPGEVSSFWLGEALASMRHDPGLHLRIFWNKLRLALGSYEVPDNHHYAWDRSYVPLLRWPWPGFLLWGGLGLAGLVLWLARREVGVGGARPAALALFFLGYLATIVLTVMSSRARLPLVVLLLPFAGLWVERCVSAIRGQGGRRTRSLAAAGWSLLIAGIVVAWPVLDEAALREDLDQREYNLAVQLREEGRLLRSRELALELLERHPASTRLRVLLADLDGQRALALREAGQDQVAQQLMQAALRSLREIATDERVIGRERARAYRLAGYLQVSLQNFGAAERFFEQALGFTPRDAELRLAHLKAREARCGQLEGALREACHERWLEELAALAAELGEGRAGREARALLEALRSKESGD